MTELCHHQDRTDLVEVLEHSHPELLETEYDNWNGGTYYYRLQLGLATGRFASLQSNIDHFEKEILALVKIIDRPYENDHISEVMITPLTEEETVYGQKLAPSEAETKRLWKEGHFRLFISHLSRDRYEAQKLKECLDNYGVDAFVAHNDIEPSLEWQGVIELALRSMDSLVALFTPEFSESKWCDQEIGWALGRGIPVIPLRLGTDPYGFAGKFQAISGKIKEHDKLANLIVVTLAKKAETSSSICQGLPAALTNSGSFAQSTKLASIIETYNDFTDAEKEIIWKACKENRQVYDAHGVLEKIYSRIGNPPSEDINGEEGVPF